MQTNGDRRTIRLHGELGRGVEQVSHRFRELRGYSITINVGGCVAQNPQRKVGNRTWAIKTLDTLNAKSTFRKSRIIEPTGEG